ncbi:hypothetical protein K438DRAFT_1859709, partial [Mycena galopus ATCC 62051]
SVNSPRLAVSCLRKMPFCPTCGTSVLGRTVDGRCGIQRTYHLHIALAPRIRRCK